MFRIFKCMKQLIINIITKLISFIDYIDFKYIKHEYLTDNYKTIEEIELPDSISILTDTGFEPVSRLMISKPFEIYKITLDNGYWLECADEHIVFDRQGNEVFVKDLKIGDLILTDTGRNAVVKIEVDKTRVCMSDITVDSVNHTFYSNGILSHNSTTTAIYCLWMILFHPDKNALILSKSGPAGKDLISKIKDMYAYLPYYLKCGTMKWNQSEISFDNNSNIATEAFSSTAGLGKTINFLILDEFAWCPANEVELFYNNIIPTVTTISDSNVCIMSTQNGFNLFYKIWKNSIEKKSIYAPFKVDWHQVPQFNPKTKEWEKRTEAWKNMMVGILGSEEAFQYQYGTQFSASDACLVSRETLSRIHSTEVLFEQLHDDDLFIPELKYFKIHPEFKLEYFKDQNRSFIVLVDLAEGGGADYTVFNIFEITIENNKPVFSQVAYWSSNVVDIEKSSLVFWVLFNTILSQQNTIVSIEWNTYGALFYNYLTMLNEPTLLQEYMFRASLGQELDLSIIVHYKKGQSDEDIAGIGSFKNSKTIPGIRWSAMTKRTGCALLKMSLESGETQLYDIVQIGELENFEDKNGNGSYKASYGHDDMMMTLVQIPMLKQTARFKDFLEEINERQTIYTNKNLLSEQYNSPYGTMTEISFGNTIPW